MYSPRTNTAQPPRDASGVIAWAAQITTYLVAEFRAIADHLGGSQEALRLRALTQEPARIYEDMVVRADGTSWNPGGGAGIYARVSGAWVKLN